MRGGNKFHARHAPKKASKAGHIATVTAMLICRDDLDGIDAAGFCRSHGLTPAQFDEMLRAEKIRRLRRG